MDADDKSAARALWQAAADLVRADLEATTELVWPLLVEADRDGLSFNYGSSGSYLSLPPSEAELVDAKARGDVAASSTVMGHLASELADRVSEDVMEDLCWPWPECNVHHRPMEPRPVGSTGTWECSQDQAHIVPIGGLAGMVGPTGLLSFT